MHLDAYRGRQRSSLFLTVPHGTNPNTIEHETVKSLVSEGLKEHKMDFHLHADDKPIAVDPKKVLADIERQGFSLDAAKVEITTTINGVAV